MLIDQMAINGMASSSSSPFFPPNFLLQIQNPHGPQDQQDFRGNNLITGLPTMLGKRFPAEEMNGDEEEEEDVLEECSHGGEKKRRLSVEQVRTLEKNFEIGNKLEPERKLQLARGLGLQPRQVAIWFQNRRARWKNKQLEKDYDVLKRQFEAVKAENEALQSHNKKLQAEISSLKGRDTSELINLNKETEGSSSNRSENSSEINLDISRTPPNESHQQGIPFFPATIRPPNFVQLLQGPKIEHNSVPDENFSNLLCNMDDQSAFWPWEDPHGFH